MTDLWNVWECAAGLELVRADRIVTVYADDGNAGYRTAVRAEATGSRRELYLKVLLAGASGETPAETVTLGRWRGDQMAGCMEKLTRALVMGTQHDGPGAVFIRPGDDHEGKPAWDVWFSLADWPVPEG